MEIRDRRGGFLWINNEIIDDYASKLGGSALLVYMVLCRYANNASGEARPSQDTLAGNCELSERSIRRALGVLEKNNLIETKRVIVKGRWDQNVYTLLVVPSSRPDKNDRPTTGQTTGHHSTMNKTEQENASVSLGQRDATEAAAALYELYPRKVAKQDALKAIKNALHRLAKEQSQQDPETYLAARVRLFASSPKGNAGEYTPHAATWFNGCRYLDDDKEWFRKEGKNGSTKSGSRQHERQQRTREHFADVFGDDIGLPRPSGGGHEDGTDEAGGTVVEGTFTAVPGDGDPVGVSGVPESSGVFPKARRYHRADRHVEAE
jgi:hypothetical protein